MKNFFNKTFYKIRNSYIPIIFFTYIVFITIRLFEFYYIKHNNLGTNSIQLLFTSINYDIFFISLTFFTLLIPILFFQFYFPKISYFLVLLLSFLIIFLDLSLTHFFLTNNYLLSNEIIFFSVNDILTIISSELSLNRIILWLIDLIIVSISLLFLFYLINRIKIKNVVKNSLSLLFVLIIFVVLINIKHSFKEVQYFNNRYEYYIGNNKIVYLFKSIKNLYKNDNINIDSIGLRKTIIEYQKLNKDFNYISYEYPLIHKDKNEDVLSDYFKKTNKKVNIVIIISESLSSSFCGNHANLINLTPFIDSLILKSLYWPNFISNAERSYGAMPNILSSLPYGGYRGFTSIYEQKKAFPDHLSLIQILKKNDYYTALYYGGWGYYESMGNFLDYSSIDKIYSDYSFDKKKYDITNGGHDNFYWGYNDIDLFSHYFETVNTNYTEKPNFSLITTLSLHTPFNLSQKKYYDVRFINNRLKKMHLSIEHVSKIFNNVPIDQIEAYQLEKKHVNALTKNTIASILFVDDALRYFFNEYAKRNDFENTVFIITGDHNIGTLPLMNELDNYRVPLIIYSPLLKKFKEFPALSSHIDILPSLLALLEKNYNIKTPKHQHWLGLGLDTVPYFRNRSNYALSLYSDNFPNFICGRYLIQNKSLSYINDSLKIIPCNESTLKDSILNIFENYKSINNYVCNNNKIWNYLFLRK